VSVVYINFQHCRALGICLSGLRRFCTTHNLDFKDFRDGKMTAEKLSATGDQFWSSKVIEQAKKNPIGASE